MGNLGKLLIVFVLSFCGVVEAGYPYGYTRSSTTGSSVRFYGRTGSYLGRATTSSGSTRFYNSRGVYAGRAKQSGSSTRYYGARGNYLGSTR